MHSALRSFPPARHGAPWIHLLQREFSLPWLPQETVHTGPNKLYFSSISTVSKCGSGYSTQPRGCKSSTSVKEKQPWLELF